MYRLSFSVQAMNQRGFSQGWFFFLCLRTKSSFIRQVWANGYKINTGQHFEAEKGEMSVGNCVISYYPDMARRRDCVVKGPFHATERKLSCKSAQRPSMCSEFWSQSGFYLEHFPSVWMRLKPGQMFYSSTQLSCLGFVLAHLGKFPGLRELPASSGWGTEGIRKTFTTEIFAKISGNELIATHKK